MTGAKAEGNENLFSGFFYGAMASVCTVELIFTGYFLFYSLFLCHCSQFMLAVNVFFFAALISAFVAYVSCVLIGFPLHKLLQWLEISSWVAYLLVGIATGLGLGRLWLFLLSSNFHVVSPTTSWLSFALIAIPTPVAALAFWCVVVWPVRSAGYE